MHAARNGSDTSISEATIRRCQVVRSTCEIQFMHALQMLRQLRDQAVTESEQRRLTGMIDRLNSRFMASSRDSQGRRRRVGST